TPPSPGDTRSPLCVGRVLDSTEFSLIDALPSTPSAEACTSLFGSFMGTMASCDSSGACASGLWLFAFPDRSRSDRDAPEVSRFSCILFRGVPGVFDYAGSDDGSRVSAVRQCCLPTDRTGSAPGSSVFAAQCPAHRCLCLRFACRLTTTGARLEVRMESLFLSCRALASPTICRFTPALSVPAGHGRVLIPPAVYEELQAEGTPASVRDCRPPPCMAR